MDNASRAARLRPISARGDAPSNSSAMQYRRSDFDVTNTVQVSSTDAVRRAVCELFRQNWPHYPFDRVGRADLHGVGDVEIAAPILHICRIRRRVSPRAYR